MIEKKFGQFENFKTSFEDNEWKLKFFNDAQINIWGILEKSWCLKSFGMLITFVLPNDFENRRKVEEKFH